MASGTPSDVVVADLAHHSWENDEDGLEVRSTADQVKACRLEWRGNIDAVLMPCHGAPARAMSCRAKPAPTPHRIQPRMNQGTARPGQVYFRACTENFKNY